MSADRKLPRAYTNGNIVASSDTVSRYRPTFTLGTASSDGEPSNDRLMMTGADTTRKNGMTRDAHSGHAAGCKQAQKTWIPQSCLRMLDHVKLG